MAASTHFVPPGSGALHMSRARRARPLLRAASSEPPEQRVGEDRVGQPKKLSKKAKRRIEQEGPKERELRDTEGNIAAESFGPAPDRKVPNWNKMDEIVIGDFLQGLKRNDFTHIEFWEDKNPSWVPKFRKGWEGRRAVVHCSDGKKRWVQMPDYPWWDMERVALDMIYFREMDVSWHKPPTKSEFSTGDMAIIAVTGGVFVLASIFLGLVKRKGLPMDQFQAIEFGQSRSEARKEGTTGVTFKDVAGLESIVGELQELVSFLQDPQRFEQVGARPPKGLLLEGPPGTGKTLIAKAIAGEAGVPFYTMTGSEFVEIIVGVGAARVRDLFKRARVNAPCIIFVDEVDALGSKRAPAIFRGNEEREQTLNQLLTEMDGFTPDAGVIFVGATNRADLLDPALTRPGRFDRKVTVREPGANARAEILRIHASKTKISDDIDLDQIANDLPGFQGADLANLVNEAALVALRREAPAIEQQDFYAAVDRLREGTNRPSLPRDSNGAKRISTHEAGKAVAASILRRKNGLVEAVERVSIVPRADEYSRTVFQRKQEESFTFPTRSRLLERMQVTLAGRAAEELVFGSPSTLADSDLLYASQLARRMVTSLALDAQVGYTSFADERSVRSDVPFGDLLSQSNTDVSSLVSAPPSNEERHRVDDKVGEIVRGQYDVCKRLLEENKASLQRVSDALFQQDQLTGEELEALV